ncbi:MAG: SRPBCC family protein [Gemmatimonadota bacterium]
MRAPLRLAWAVVGGLALAGTAFLVIGLLLPRRWEVQRSRALAATPEQVFPFVSDLDEWPRWMPWDDLDGMGATDPQVRTWDDPRIGQGALRLTEVHPDTVVRYEVEVEGGLSTAGSLRLQATPDGSVLTWSETGEFGRNPLLGYVALGMDRLQGAEMEKSLDRLAQLLR